MNVRRVFIQDGVQVENPTVTVGDQEFSSITDEFCATEKVTFGDHDSFTANGGLKAMGESLDRGHVFVMSLWDDNCECGRAILCYVYDFFLFPTFSRA